MPDTRASNPTSSGPSLLDKSTARPGEVDMAIFERNQAQSGSATSGGSQKSQGAVNANYLEECRRDNPTPADEKSAKRTVTLSDCRIDTPSEDLATDQPFKMSCVATSSNGKPVTGGVTFRLFCTLPDGTEEDTGLAKVGKREGDRICAEGMLYSPKKLVEWGEELKYRVVAEHGEAAEKEASEVAEVVGHMPPKPIAIWQLEEEYFLENAPFILPTAKKRFEPLAEFLLNNPQSVVSVFVAIQNKEEFDLSLARAWSLYALLTRDTQNWQTPNGYQYNAKQLERIKNIKRDTCEHYAYAPHAQELLYMNLICGFRTEYEAFVGDPDDLDAQWGVVVCDHKSILTISESQGANKSKLSTELVAATLLIYREQAKGPGAIEYPCASLKNASNNCKNKHILNQKCIWGWVDSQSIEHI